MNAIGEFGKWIIEYQYQVEVGLLILLGLIIVIWLIRMIARAVKRRSVLLDIDKKITDMSEKVDRMSAAVPEPRPASKEVGADGAAAAEAAAVAVVQPAATLQVTPGASGSPDAAADAVPHPAPHAGQGTAYVLTETGPQDGRPAEEPPRRFYSRDCGVDKHGNVYTEEMLEQQIR